MQPAAAAVASSWLDRFNSLPARQRQQLQQQQQRWQQQQHRVHHLPAFPLAEGVRGRSGSSTAAATVAGAGSSGGSGGDGGGGAAKDSRVAAIMPSMPSWGRTNGASNAASNGARRSTMKAGLSRIKTMMGGTAIMMMTMMMTAPPESTAKVVYGEDITEPTLDRDFGPEETTQAELAWDRYRARRKAGLATPLPSKTNLPPQQYLAIIYTYKQESFEELKNYLRRAAEKQTVTSMQGEFRRMAVSLLENAFNDMRQSMYYLPLAVAQKNAALGFNLQRRYDVVERELEELDRDINLLAYSGGRSDITNEDLLAIKQSIKDLERATDQFTEYATEAIAQL
uniref:Uncharacterized protein n=1 Tax=Lotharella oceanica TaxID=641309 RepID=A0A7S2XCV2_9EUKA